MPHIRELSPHVADLIAAGEVVERPASVIKELCENAVDAGARSVTVEIQSGGMSLIRVTDDGCGIAPDECATAFLRHATSKISTEYDLEAIGTLGFRGEALASIAAVARVELLTRRKEDALGTAFSIEGGRPGVREEAGCPVGTTFLVRDLFFNTPARLKFMKKDVAEGAACLAAVQKQALGHPEVAFKFIRDGKQELLTPGDGQLRSAMYAVLGRELALGFLPAEGSGEDMKVSGFVSQPSCCRGNRGYQFFFVNGRYVKSQALTAALEQAYANRKMVGKFPGCVIHLTVKLNSVDVNVHPTKQEVKFGAERAVFSAVYHAVMSALGEDTGRPDAAGALRPHTETGVQTTLPIRDGSWQGMGSARERLKRMEALNELGAMVREKREAVSAARPKPAPASPLSRPAPVPPEEPAKPAEDLPPRPAERVAEPQEPAPEPVPVRAEPPAEPPRPVPAAAEGPEERPAADEAGGEQPPPHEEAAPGAEMEPYRVVGELFRTYVVVEQGEKTLLIDKHAAHERMNFDRMRSQGYEPMSQFLLTPVVFTPAPEEYALLLEHTGELDKAGFEVEDFGAGSVVVRRCPDYLDAGEVPAALGEIAGKLSLTGSTGEEERMDEIWHTMACKAAIKGGWRSAGEELDVVVRSVLSGQVRYCPHGRPVAVELTRAQLEKQFRRRV